VSSAGLAEGRSPARSANPRAALRLGNRRKVLDRARTPVVAAAAAVALLPLLRPGGPGSIAPVDLLIALALAACVFWGVSSEERWHFPYAFAMLLFVAGGVIGALSGPVPGSGVKALIQDAVLLSWCWAVLNICISTRSIKILLRTWAYSSIVWAALLFVGLATGTTELTGRTARGASRTMLTFGDPNVAANYLFISVMVIWATGRPRRPLFRYAGYGLLVAAIISTGSNSGIISLIGGVAAAALLGVYRRGGTVAATTTLCFLLLGGYLVATNVNFKSIQDRAHTSRYAFIRDGIGRQEESVAQRGSILHESIHLYQLGGPLGTGPVSTKPRLRAEQAPLVKEAHDDYLAALNERGVIGVLGLALLLGGVLLRALSLLKKPLLARALPSDLVRPNALVGALVGTLIAMTVFELLHVRHVWTLFAFVAALALRGNEWRRSEPS
jgi:O-antigen ligase/polysaccharide polymerase Wzy-like membrane protein